MTRLLTVLVAVAMAAGALSLGAGSARAEINVVSQQAQNRFPGGMQFSAFIIADSPIQEARLRYQLSPTFFNTTARATCTTSGAGNNCTVTIGQTDAQYMVPGTDIRYYWEIVAQNGETLSTPEQSTRYEDARFQWDSVQEGDLIGYYYSGSEESVRNILRTANETLLDTLDLLGGEIRTPPIKVWIYATNRDLADAASGRNAGHGLAGQVSVDDTALMSRENLALDIVRHEIAHIAVRQAEFRFINSMPIWVNEGLAMWSQRQIEAPFRSALDLAIRRNATLPIETLSASVRDGNSVNLFYAQSASMVGFMIDTYGREKFREFFQALANQSFNGALEQAYGLDQLGLENAWRRSVGLPPVETGGGQGSNPSAIPTRVPFGSQGQGSAATPAPVEEEPEESAPSAEASGGGGNNLVVIIGGLTAVAALGLLGAGLYFARKMA